MTHPAEMNRGIIMPVQVYPLFEQALRAAAGRSIDDHLVRISELWSRFSAVAATETRNAWSQTGYTAEEIRTPARQPLDRLPVSEAHELEQQRGQGAALIVVLGRGGRAGRRPPQRWVFPHSGATHDTNALVAPRRSVLVAWHPRRAEDRRSRPGGHRHRRHRPHRPVLVLSLGGADRRGRARSGRRRSRPAADRDGRVLVRRRPVEQLRHPLDRHDGRRASRRPRLRSGLCSANGGFITKHAFGVYSTTPPADGFKWSDAQDEADRLTKPRDVAPGDYEGKVTIEAWTVMHSRDGQPENGIAAALLADGRRTWGTTQDADVRKAHDRRGTRRTRRPPRRQRRPLSSELAFARSIWRRRSVRLAHDRPVGLGHLVEQLAEPGRVKARASSASALAPCPPRADCRSRPSRR